MNKQCGKVFFNVPTDIAPGSYLVRAEVIALHVASSAGGAQVCSIYCNLRVDCSQVCNSSMPRATR
jgi:hypothetical protein